MKKKQGAMYENTKTLVRSFKSLLEVIILSIIYYIVWKNGYDSGVFPAYAGGGKFVLMGIYGILVYVFFHNTEGFQFGNLRKMDLILAQGIALCIINFITYFQLSLIANRLINPIPILILMLIDMVVALVLIVVYTKIYYSLYAPHQMIMIFGTEDAVSLKIKMDSRTDKYQVAKLMPVEDGFEAICEEIVNYDAVVLNDVSAQMRNDILKFCYQNQIRVYVAPKVTDIMMRGARNISSFDTPLFLVKGTGLNIGQRAIKRTIDVLISLIVTVIALPILLLVALAIKVEDRGPVFYTQERVTRGGKVFKILKFRSMIVDAEKDGLSIPATGGDPRITKVGRFIRATRIDELPQILNILKGDMSIVGPRPERVEHVEKYSKEIPEFEYRLKVKGGLTGYAQIYGKYNTSAYDKLRLDMLYIENYSVALDIKLILLTLRVMLQKESTEGFEVAKENQLKKDEILKQLNQERKQDGIELGEQK